MKSHPLLYKAAMVRADLAGIKLNTRRVATVHNSYIDGKSAATNEGKALWAELDWSKACVAAVRAGLGQFPAFIVPGKDGSGRFQRTKLHRVTPKYAVGDEVWFREAWRAVDDHLDPFDGIPNQGDGADILYRATPNKKIESLSPGRWFPSIHMPRWASRISHILSRVGAEFVQDISEEDARDEGIQEWNQGPPMHRHGLPEWPTEMRAFCARNAFAKLWDSINKARGFGWDANPPVWPLRWEKEKA